jgi:hypothetical protein
VPDYHPLIIDTDFPDQEPNNPLSLLERTVGRAAGQAAQEALEVLSKLQVSLLIEQARFKGLQVSAKPRFLLAKLWQATAKLVERQQILLISREQPIYCGRHSAKFHFQARFLGSARIARSELSQTAI